MVEKRTNLKVIVSSANLELEKFKAFFNNPPLVTIPGRLHDVDVLWQELPPPEAAAEGGKRWKGKGKRVNCMQAKREKQIAELVVDLNAEEPAGDMLCFVSGQEEIERVCSKIRKRVKTATTGTATGAQSGRDPVQLPALEVMPCHATMPMEEQAAIFKQLPAGVRKVIVATNIAETSITVSGIRFVIDSGAVKEKTCGTHSFSFI